MGLRPDDLVRVRIKALTGDHKIADWWESTPYQVIDQLDGQPVFKVRPITTASDEDTTVLHRTCCFLSKPVKDIPSQVRKMLRTWL